MSGPTRLHRLVTTLFAERHDEPLPDWIAARRAEGLSWRRIADQLEAETGGEIDVSHVTLIDWFGDRDRAVA